MRQAKLQELAAELRQVFAGRDLRLLDTLLPPLIFLGATLFLPLQISIYASLAAAVLIAGRRLLRKQSLVYALGGLGGVGLAAVFAWLSGSGSGFFIPGLISGALTVLLCVISVAVNRPLVAWTSHLVRRWPRRWYWHPQVLPAYNEVTIAWGLAFALRLALEIWLLRAGATTALGSVRLLLGWPFTILLLIGSYLYGQARLGALGGPSVEEFQETAPPPWSGQRTGF